MAVIAVAGNVANMPSCRHGAPADNRRGDGDVLPSGPLDRQALFAIGLILFVFIMIVNISPLPNFQEGARVDAQ